MSETAHRTVETNGIRMHVAEQGEGPLVVLCHGFPESWYSWRHQLRALADAGFHAVAPDMRGYGRTEAPAEIDRYSMLHLVGDIVGLLDALGAETAVIAGHDWGAPVAWHAALLRPDRVRGVIGLSVPYRPRGSTPPLTVLRAALGPGFYMLYFQEPGRADEELARDIPATFRKVLYAASGTAPPLVPIVPPGGGFLDLCPDPAALPGPCCCREKSWISGCRRSCPRLRSRSTSCAVSSRASACSSGGGSKPSGSGAGSSSISGNTSSGTKAFSPNSANAVSTLRPRSDSA